MGAGSLGKWSQHQDCSRNVWTMLSDTWGGSWDVLYKTRSWTLMIFVGPLQISLSCNSVYTHLSDKLLYINWWGLRADVDSLPPGAPAIRVKPSTSLGSCNWARAEQVSATCSYSRPGGVRIGLSQTWGMQGANTVKREISSSFIFWRLEVEMFCTLHCALLLSLL